jgi:hypothetical protein
LFVTAVLESYNEVAGVEFSVGIPITLGPSGIAVEHVVVLTCLRYNDEIGTVELAVQIGVAKPSVRCVADPDVKLAVE